MDEVDVFSIVASVVSVILSIVAIVLSVLFYRMGEQSSKDIAEKAQEEIRDLSNSYPQYTMEIMEMVAVYEEKFK